MGCCIRECGRQFDSFRGASQACDHPWDAYFRDLCALYPTLSTSMGYDRDNAAVEEWSERLFERERELLRHYVMKTHLDKKACRETRVFHTHLLTRLRCLEVDRVQLFHSNGGWCVELLEMLLHYQPHHSASDRELMQVRLKKMPGAIQGYAEFLQREAVARPPAQLIVAAMRQRLALECDTAEASPFFLLDRLRAYVIEPMRRHVLRFLDTVVCRTTLGLSDLPPAVYDGAVYRHITLDGVTAEEIHSFGLEEVVRLEAIIAAMPEPVDSPVYRGEAAVEKYRQIVDAMQVHPALSQYFGDLRPSRSCKVVQMRESHRANGPLAYYTNSAFHVNTNYAHPAHQMEALAFHEAVPGHHTQRRIERDLLPDRAFRYHVHHTAFVEGWAMYVESLLPTTLKYGSRGIVESEIFRAARLVVDTGIHRMHWSHSKALGYLKKHGRITDEEAEAEILRYACDPGQALGYHVGRCVFNDIACAHADDLVAVHQRILRQGSVPMNMLVRQFLASKRLKPVFAWPR